MGLIITKPTQYGIDATYFNITKLMVDSINNDIEVRLSGWKDKPSMEEGNTPIINIVIKNSNFKFSNLGNTLTHLIDFRDGLEEIIITLPDWSDATIDQ